MCEAYQHNIVDPLHVLKTVKAFVNQTVIMALYLKCASSQPHKCLVGKSHTFQNVVIMPSENFSELSVEVKEFTIKSTEGSFEYLMCHDKVLVFNATTCMMPIQTCTKVILDNSSYLKMNNSLFLKETMKHVPDQHFIVVNDSTIAVCANIVMNDIVLNTSRFTEEILSFTGSLVSMISLLTTFTIYATKQELRTVPGNMLMNYMSVLFVAQLTLQLNRILLGYDIACKIVAITQHYMWLATFTCMTAFANKLARTFSSGFRVTPGNEREYLTYTLISFLIPLAIVLPCIILDAWYDNVFVYVDTDSCWISDLGHIGK